MYRSYKQQIRKLSYFALTLYSGVLCPMSLSCQAMENHSTVGVIEAYFDPWSGNTRRFLTQSTMDTFAKEDAQQVINYAKDENFGSHHANHVVSIIHHMSPKSQIRLIDLRYEEGVNNKATGEARTIAAIDKAIESKVDFINISRRISPFNDWNGAISSAMQEALLRAKEAGIGIIKSAGNDGEYTGTSAYTDSLHKLLMEMDGSMVMVVALDEEENDLAWDFSNKAGKAHRYVIAAPGEEILGDGADNIQIIMNGTSMAAPYVTGLAANLRQAYGLSSKEALDCILQTAYRDNVFQTRLLGRGKVDTGKASQAAGSLAASKGQSPE